MWGTQRNKSRSMAVRIIFIAAYLVTISFLPACIQTQVEPSPEEYFSRANELYNQGKFLEAKTTLDTIAFHTAEIFGEESPECAWISSIIADCLRGAGNNLAAESIYFSILAVPSGSTPSPGKSHSYEGLGELYMDLGEYDLAIQYLHEGRIFTLETGGPTDSLLTNIASLLIQAYFLDSNMDSAIIESENYLSLRQRQPSYADSSYLTNTLHLSEWYADDGRCPDAESLVSRVISDSVVEAPEYSQIVAQMQLLIGHCRAKSGDFNAALLFLEPALSLARSVYSENDPGLIHYLSWLGYALARTGSPLRADSLYSEVIRLAEVDPLMTPPRLAKLLLEKSDILTKLGRYDDAQKLKVEALKLDSR